jgi:hypothetical protein
MIEFALLTLVIFLFLNRTKKKRKPRTLDGQLQELITQSTDATSIAVDIKRYLLNTINDNNSVKLRFLKHSGSLIGQGRLLCIG